MSQKKVDRYKLEKKNRQRDMKKAKVKKVLLIFLFAMILGALIGIPLGRWIYNYKTTHVKEEEVFISSNEYEDWFNQYWVDNYSDLVTGASLATEQNTGDTTADTEAACPAMKRWIHCRQAVHACRLCRPDRIPP